MKNAFRKVADAYRNYCIDVWGGATLPKAMDTRDRLSADFMVATGLASMAAGVLSHTPSDIGFVLFGTLVGTVGADHFRSAGEKARTFTPEP